MDTTANQWPKDPIAPPSASARGGEKKVRAPQKDEIINCPRCHSTNTKFCYYNNYSLTQPRYFCKTCRRYWTAGGSLRNVPVGGGSRKNTKRSSSHQNPNGNIINPHNIVQNQDLNNLANFSHHQFPQPPKIENNHNNNNMFQLNLNSSFLNASSCSSTTTTTSSLSAMELLKRTGINANNSFCIPSSSVDPNMIYASSGYSFQEFKPMVGFTSVSNGAEEAGSTLVFPFGSIMTKQISSTNDEQGGHEQNKGPQGHNDPTLFWNGMTGGGYNGNY